MNQMAAIIIPLIKSVICAGAVDSAFLQSLPVIDFRALYALAKTHDLAHLVGLAIERNKLLRGSGDGMAGTFKNAIFAAVFRYETLAREFDRLCAALETAELPFIPLKGSVIRKYYPEPWMRTSGDIDVLIHESNLEKAIKHLVDNCEYRYGAKGAHDVSLTAPCGIHVELHYNLLEEGRVRAAFETLREIWSDVSVKDGYRYWSEMSDEMFYFYHVAHMAKHFQEGGCGIRSFLDLWLLNHKAAHDYSKRMDLIEKGGLRQFESRCRKLSEIWFADEPHDNLTLLIQDYVLRGGVYGSKQNQIQVRQVKSGGKLRYALSKIFPPYDVIKFHYPILQRHRCLTPLYMIRRWFKLIFFGGFRSSLDQLDINRRVTREQAEKMNRFLNDMGLDI